MPLFDILFGTFCYRPDRLPARLGVQERLRYPRARQFFRVMLLPLHGD